MSRGLVDGLLVLLGGVIILVWIFYQLKDLIYLPKKEFFKFKRFKYPLLLIIIIGIPLYIANNTNLIPFLNIEQSNIPFYNLYCWVIAFFVSIVWLQYILKLDIYEKEKWKHIAFVFISSIITTYGCYILYPICHALGFNLNGNVVNDFFYCIFGIGLIEETVKFIPFFILLKYTKAINEPYDYLLYASVSALGFAFAENAMYLNNYGIHIVAARAFYAAVAHMTFCSTVAYGLLLKKYRFPQYPTILVFLVFFFIAMFIHGFYDFWLINKQVSSYNGITTIFLLITIHLWFTMKNNAINISPFHNEKVKLDNDKLKQYLVISLCSIFMFSYLYVVLIYGKHEGMKFFWGNMRAYGYVVFYLIISFSNYNIIKGKFNPLKISFNFIVPTLNK